MGALKLFSNRSNYQIEDFYRFQEQINTGGLMVDGEPVNRLEFYNGEIWFMAGGTISHARLCRNLIYNFSQQLEGTACEPFGSDAHLAVDEINTILHPDMFVTCGEVIMSEFDKNGITNAVVIIEVLSDSTTSYDRVGKFRKYKKIPTFKEYVLVNQKQALIETFVKHENDLWIVNHFDGLDTILKIQSLNIEIPLVKIYKDLFDENTNINVQPN